MARGHAPKQAQRGSAKKRPGSTSTAARGLVLHVIKNDAECDWLADFIQQLGEKFFEVESFGDLNEQQRSGWIRFNYAMARIGRSVARREGDFNSFLTFLERVGEDEKSPDLVQVEAEIEDLDGAHRAEGEGEGRREEEMHRAHLLDREVWRGNQRTLVRLIAFSVLFSAAMATCGAVTEKAMFLGAAGLGTGMAAGLLRAVLSGDPSPFSDPWRSASAEEGRVGRER